MCAYKILVNDRNCETWNFIDPLTSNNIEDEVLANIHPFKDKLFTGDYFHLDSEKKITITHSIVRNQCNIPGILILMNNKSYGRGNKKLLYKCIPDDIRLPEFLVPYEIKMGFDKNFKNKYVVFKFDHWENEKHPCGKLECTIGNINTLEHFYEYQLYCKSLHISINDFTHKAKQVLKQPTFDNYLLNMKNDENMKITELEEQYIFSIDPKSTCDYDDALSIRTVGTKTIVNVYITNVFACLETLDLWDSFSKRVSTIYLPDRRRPMLPSILSEMLCSLKQREERPVIVYSFTYEDSTLIDFKISNSIVKINKNFSYDDKKIEQNKHYCMLYNFTVHFEDIRGTCDVVAYWMKMVNKHSSFDFINHKNGIFRTLFYINKDDPLINNEVMSDNAARTIRNWNNISGQYVYYNSDENFTHELMNESSYVHITSPLRRLVDLLNQIETMENLCVNVSKSALKFKNDWLTQMEYINNSMRSIRKVQSECELLFKCHTRPEMYDEIYDGIVFGKMKQTDGSYSYMVLLDKINILTRYISHVEMNNHSTCKFKLYLFEDEHKLKKKIKIKLFE
jgi:exoribonuclease R